jgi:hypothetical protein
MRKENNGNGKARGRNYLKDEDEDALLPTIRLHYNS